MSGYGAGSPFPPLIGQYVGHAAEMRQQAALMHAQMGMMQSSNACLSQSLGMAALSGMARGAPVKKSTYKLVCAYCNGQDYKSRNCPGCGATEKKRVQA